MMMRNGNKVLVIGLVLLAGFASSASAVTKGMKKVVEDALDFSVRQSMSMFGEMKDQKGILPRTAKDGEMITCDSGWWTSGFYPGTLWYCYEYSNDPQVRAAAEEMTSQGSDRDCAQILIHPLPSGDGLHSLVEQQEMAVLRNHR